MRVVLATAITNQLNVLFFVNFPVEIAFLQQIYRHTMGGQKKVNLPHYNAVVVYKMRKVPKQFKNTHGAVQINGK